LLAVLDQLKRRWGRCDQCRLSCKGQQPRPHPPC
jgi:hypothetical protein